MRKAQRTPWYYLLVAFLLGALGGALLALMTRSSGVELLGASWIVPAVLVFMGVLTLSLGWSVRRYIKDETKDIDPKRAVNTLVLAKSMEVVGSILFGWYLGQLGIIVVHPDSSWARRIITECAVAAGAALFAMVAGIVAEGWCQLPPTDGPENPRVTGRRKSRGRQVEPSPKVEEPSLAVSRTRRGDEPEW